MAINNPTLISIYPDFGNANQFITDNITSLTFGGTIYSDANGGSLGLWLSGGSLTQAVFIGLVTIPKNVTSWSLSNDNIQSLVNATGQSLNDGSYVVSFTNGSSASAPIGTSQTITIDNTLPAVISITDNAPPVAIGSFVFTVTFNESVTGVTPRSFTATNATVSTVVAASTPNTYLVTVIPKANVDHGQVSLSLVAGTQFDIAGDYNLAADLSNLASVTIDTVIPKVTGVTTSGTGIINGNGDLNAGNVVYFDVAMSKVVQVTGTPTLSLNDGGTATYVSGSGTQDLVFSYTVAAGQNTSDLTVSSFNANGSKVLDLDGNAANMLSAVANPPGTLQIDTLTPTVSTIGTQGPGIVNGAGELNVGQVVTFNVNMSEAVNVDTSNGSPTLTLNDGEIATYIGVSSAKTLQFSYTVVQGDMTPRLSVTGLNLNGASIADLAGNLANVSNVSIIPPGVLIIDTSKPIIVATGTGISNGNGVLNAGHVVTLSLTMDRQMSVTGTPTLTLNDGGTATFMSLTNNSKTLVFSYTVQQNQVTPNLAVTGYTGTIIDQYGVAVRLANTTTGTLQIDAITPVPVSEIASGTGITNGSGYINAGHIVNLSVTMNENVTVSGGTPTLTLNDGGIASYVSGSGSNVLVFSYTVTAGQNTTSLQATHFNLNGAKVVDAGGNLAISSGAITANGNVDIITTIHTPSANLQADTGISSTDGVTANGQINVQLDINVASWQYSTNGGISWTTQTLTSTSFTLADGSYTAGQVLIKQTDLAGNISSAYSLGAISVASSAPTLNSITGSLAALSNQNQDTISVNTTAEAVNGNAIVSVLIKDANNAAFSGVAQLQNGAWVYTASGLAEGAHNFYAVVTDTAGNVLNSLTSSNLNLSIATQAPTDTDSQSSISLSNVTTDTISGVASAEAQTGNAIKSVEVFDGSHDLGAATLNSSTGAWSFNASGLSDGNHQFKAVITDLAGNQTTDSSLTAITVATAAPTDTDSQTSTTLSNVTTDTISGVASAEAQIGNAINSVEIFDGSQDLGAATLNSNTGVWSFNATGLSDGNHQFKAVITDLAGNQSTDSSLAAITVATVAPTDLDSQTSSTLSNVTSDIISGVATAEAQIGNAIKSVEIFDGSQDLGAATLNSSGAWSFTASGLSDGNHQFKAVITDLAGNQSTDSSLAAITIATAAPTDTDSQSSSILSNINSDTISGVATAEAQPGNAVKNVEIFDGYHDLGAAILNTTTGAWSFTATDLSDGNHQFKAVITDLAGNQTTDYSLVAVTVAMYPPIDSASQSSISLSNVTTDSLSGLAIADAQTGNAINSVEIFDANHDLGAATLNSNTGVWSFNATGLSDGNHQFKAVITDLAGNQTIDSSLTAITVATAAPTDSDSQSSISLSNVTSDTISGVASAEAQTGNAIKSVEIFDGSQDLGAATLNSNTGAWSFNATGLSDGNHQFKAVITDLAGNQSTDSSLASIAVATLAPTDIDSQTSSSLSNINSDSLNGTAHVEAIAGNAIKSIEIYDGNTDLGAATLNSLTGAWTYKANNLSDGDHKFKAVISDTAGNQYTDSSLNTISIATQAPSATAVESVSGATYANSDTITVTASAEAVTGNQIATVAIYDNGNFVANATKNGNGSWTFTDTGLSGGNHNFSSVVTDLAGNSLTTSSLPTLTVIPVITASSYDAGTGQLVLTGYNLGGAASLYNPSYLTLTGQNGISYQLTGGTVQGQPTNTQVVIDLSSDDQLALAGLLNKAGLQAIDGTIFNLATSPGWDQGGTEIDTIPVTVSDVNQPSISSVSYDASTQILTVTGSNFVNHGGSPGINLNDFTLSAGITSQNVNTAGGYVINETANQFTVQLPSGFNALFSANGTSADGNVYNLAASSGWDSGLGATINVTPIQVSGDTIILAGDSSTSLLDTATANPFQHLTLTDVNSYHTDSATISFSAANGKLSGSGLSAGVISNGTVTYTLDATNPTNLQTELQNLLFTPTAHQVAAGQTVTTQFNLKINAYTSQPSSLLSTGISTPKAIVTDNAGHIYIANASLNNVVEYNSTGQIVNTLSSGVSSPNALAIDSSGDVYVSNFGNSTLEEFSSNGSLLRTIKGTNGVSGPISITTDPSGNLYVGNSGPKPNTVTEYSSTGTTPLRVLSTGLANPISLATDNNGNLFVANLYNHNVQEFNASGVLQHTLTATANGISSPQAVITDSKGDLFVANSGNNTVEEFNSSAVLIHKFGNHIYAPHTLALDSSGDLFVGNAGNGGSVVEFSNSGQLLQVLTTGFNPNALATDSNGNLYISNPANNSVEKFSTSIPVASTTDSNNSVNVTDTANATIATASGSLTKPTVLSNPHHGDTVSIADATIFHTTAISTANVTAAGGNSGTLAGWVAGAFSKVGAHLAQHEIGWFNFAGNTYLVEQAHAVGTAFGAGDTLVQLVGTFNESNAQLNGHVLTL